MSSPPWGHVAEWLRNGLQNRVHQFNSGRGLQLYLVDITQNRHLIPSNPKLGGEASRRGTGIAALSVPHSPTWLDHFPVAGVRASGASGRR